MEHPRPYRTSAALLAARRSTSAYQEFRRTLEWLAAIGYVALGVYAGVVSGLQGFAFGIMAVASCAVGAAGLHVAVQVILILVDIADAHIATLEESHR